MSRRLIVNNNHTNGDICTCKTVQSERLNALLFYTEPKRSWCNDKNSEWPWRDENHSGNYLVFATPFICMSLFSTDSWNSWSL